MPGSGLGPAAQPGRIVRRRPALPLPSACACASAVVDGTQSLVPHDAADTRLPPPEAPAPPTTAVALAVAVPQSATTDVTVGLSGPLPVQSPAVSTADAALTAVPACATAVTAPTSTSSFTSSSQTAAPTIASASASASTASGSRAATAVTHGSSGEGQAVDGAGEEEPVCSDGAPAPFPGTAATTKAPPAPPPPVLDPASSTPFCPTRLDTDPLFYLLLHALALDIAEIDENLREDALSLNDKISQARRAYTEMGEKTSRARAAAHELEGRLVGWMREREAAVHVLHTKLTGGEALALASGSAASSTAGARATAVSTPHGPSASASGGATAPSSGSAGISARTPIASPPRGAATEIQKYGQIISHLSELIKDQTAAWKEAVAEHATLAMRADELKGVCDAVMAQLIFVSNRAEADKATLMRMLVYALSDAWTEAMEGAGDGQGQGQGGEGDRDRGDGGSR